MADLPFMPFYVGDYLADTTHLTVTEHGAYLLLLMSLWRNESLPDDDKILARHARCTSGQWARMRPVIMPYFDVADGRVTHGRVSHDLTKTREAVEQRALRSSNGGRAKALKYKRRTGAKAVPKPCQSKSYSEEEANASSVADAPPQKTKRVSRQFPENWTLTPANIAYAASRGLNQQETARAAEDFRDYFLAAGDKRSTDWSLNWQRWCRKASDDLARSRAGMAGRPYPGRGGRQDTTFADIAARRRREREEGMAVPREPAPVSGLDLGWGDGAIDGNATGGGRQTGGGHDPSGSGGG